MTAATQLMTEPRAFAIFAAFNFPDLESAKAFNLQAATAGLKPYHLPNGENVWAALTAEGEPSGQIQTCLWATQAEVNDALKAAEWGARVQRLFMQTFPQHALIPLKFERTATGVLYDELKVR